MVNGCVGEVRLGGEQNPGEIVGGQVLPSQAGGCPSGEAKKRRHQGPVPRMADPRPSSHKVC